MSGGSTSKSCTELGWYENGNLVCMVHLSSSCLPPTSDSRSNPTEPIGKSISSPRDSPPSASAGEWPGKLGRLAKQLCGENRPFLWLWNKPSLSEY